MGEPTLTPAGAIRVAVVDDHRLVLDGITAGLRMNRRLHVVASEPTWVGLLTHEEFPVDVVVLDLQLRDQIAIGFKLKALEAAGVRTVVMSRHTDAATIALAIQCGARSFVPKTESVDELVEAIECAAENRPYSNQLSRDALATVLRSTGPKLGHQERRALMLYSTGSSVKEVAATMDTTEDTVKSYLKRGRRKYRAAGVDIGTKTLLKRQAILEGWISPE